MSINHVIQSMQDDGFSFDYEGDCLRVMPANRLTDNYRAYIKANKHDIINALQNPLLITVYCPNGNPIQVLAKDEDHARYLLLKNPPPRLKLAEE
jgi:hypothetical protein